MAFRKSRLRCSGGDHALPVPLIDVGAVIVIEEVIFAHGAHVGAKAFARLHAKLLQRHPLPLGGGLHYLRVDGVLVVIVRRCGTGWGARAVAVEQVVDAALFIDDQRHFDHHQVELFAEVVFDVALHLEDRPLRFFGRQQRAVVLRQNLFEELIIANAGACEVRFFVSHAVLLTYVCGRRARQVVAPGFSPMKIGPQRSLGCKPRVGRRSVARPLMPRRHRNDNRGPCRSAVTPVTSSCEVWAREL